MRKFHRWIMTVCAVLLSYWVVSGLTLAIYDATDSEQQWAVDGGGAGARTPVALDDFIFNRASPLTAGDVPVMTNSAMTAVKAVAPDQPVAAVELSIVEGVHQAIVSVGQGANLQRLRFDTQTGSLLERSTDMDKWLDLPPPSLHSTLKTWHRGNVVGVSGVYLALLTATAIILLSLTGIALYLDLRKRRKAVDRGGFFWSEPATRAGAVSTRVDALPMTGKKLSWRTLHRWVSIVAAAFLLHLSITGLILACSSIQQGLPSNPRAGFSSDEVLPLMTDLYDDASKAVPDAPLISLRLRMFFGQPFGLPLFGGEQGGQLAIRPDLPGAHNYVISYSGSSLGGAHWDTHTWIKRLHRGDFIGSFSGRYISITAGVCLLFLLLSGIKMYFELWSRRRSAGHSGLFWK